MFGQLRFLLAYLVIVSHLIAGDYWAHFGFYAVVGFFVMPRCSSARNRPYLAARRCSGILDRRPMPGLHTPR